MTKTILACRYTGSLSIHQLEGGALPSIKPCYWNGSNDSAGVIVKSLSGLHIGSKAKAKKNSERLTHAEGLFVQHECNVQHCTWCIFQTTVQSVYCKVLPPLCSLKSQVSKPPIKCEPPSYFTWPSRGSEVKLIFTAGNISATVALIGPHS